MLSRNNIVMCLISLIIFSCSKKKDNPNYNLSPAKSIQKDSLSNIDGIDVSVSNSNDNSETEFSVMENESLGNLKYGMPIQEVIKSLGNPDRETEPEFWTGDGEYHRKVEYLKQGITLDVVGGQETQTINMITLNNPSKLKTLKKVGIGSSYREVEEAYMEQIARDFSNSESIVVGSIYGGLIFYFKNSKVESIFIGAAAE